jgi:uncharacterized membrane protein
MRMSDRVSGRPGRHVAGRLALVLGLVATVAGPAAPLVGAVEGLTVTTPFPAVVVEAGDTASFRLSVDVTVARRVDLRATGVPSGWTARLRGGGLVVDGAFVDPDDPPEITLDVEVPDEAPPGASTITVEATSGPLTERLGLTIRVAETVAGSVSLASDFPELRGPSDTTFTFTVTLSNDTAAEAAFAMDAIGPAGWTVSARPAGQAQATSTTVAAGGTGSITVTAEAPTGVAAGAFPIAVTVSGGGETASLDLQVVITGTYTLIVSTPDQVLSTTANAGSTRTFQLTITNTGSAPVTAITPSASTPSSWEVTFDPESIVSIEPGATETVSAQITPTSDAIAGDYDVTMTASGAEASDSVTIRVRVETPQFWWIVGVVLIGATFAGLYWVFRTYGRR